MNQSLGRVMHCVTVLSLCASHDAANFMVVDEASHWGDPEQLETSPTRAGRLGAHAHPRFCGQGKLTRVRL